MIAEAGAAISGIKVAMDMAKGISALKSETEVNQAIIDIQQTLLEAQSAALDDKQKISLLVAEKAALEKKLAGADLWAQEKERYVLTESETGMFTFELRPEFANGETHHRLCANCFENGRKSILHGKRVVACLSCEKKISLNYSPPIKSTRSLGW
jgi:hypothetical protein